MWLLVLTLVTGEARATYATQPECERAAAAAMATTEGYARCLRMLAF